MNLWPFRRRADRVIGTLIKAPVRRFTGFDQALAERTAARRKQADEIRQDAARFESNGIRKNKFQVVK